jgi:hypothetical protein
MATINITVQSLLNAALYDSYAVDDAGTIGELIGKPRGHVKGNKKELWEVKFPTVTWILSRNEFICIP